MRHEPNQRLHPATAQRALPVGGLHLSSCWGCAAATAASAVAREGRQFRCSRRCWLPLACWATRPGKESREAVAARSAASNMRRVRSCAASGAGHTCALRQRSRWHSQFAWQRPSTPSQLKHQLTPPCPLPLHCARPTDPAPHTCPQTPTFHHGHPQAIELALQGGWAGAGAVHSQGEGQTLPGGSGVAPAVARRNLHSPAWQCVFSQ